MSRSLKTSLKSSDLARVLLVPYRMKFALSYYVNPLRNLFRWVVTSREHANLTYDLDSLNERYLAAMISTVTGESHAKILGYMNEIKSDQVLRDHIFQAVKNGPSRGISDRVARYGRRIGWYALVRATKPKKVVETGVEKGLGSCVIAAALKKNAEEGSQGIAYGTDINPAAGYLVGGVYAPYSKIFYGDSIESLKTLEGPIDLFINDSDHSAEYEAREYDTIEPKLSSGALVLGDNAHVTDKLLLFAEKTRRSFLYFQERPSGHWYPGAGIGIAFKADVSHNR